MIGLSNTKIGLALMLETLKEFRKHISGGGVSNNLVNFVDPKNAEEERLVNNYLEIFASQGESTREAEMQAVKDIYFYSLLDNTTGAYLMKDIISGTPFAGSSEVTLSEGAGVKGSAASGAKSLKLNDYLLTLYEKIEGAELTSTLITNDFDYEHSADMKVKGSDPASVHRLVTPVKTVYTSELPDDLKEDDAYYTTVNEEGKEVKNVRPNLNFATPTNVADTVYVNASGPDSTPDDSNRFIRPGLGAVVVRAPELGFTSRNAEQLNLFFNAITPLEMSRCVPYINVAVVTAEDKNKPKNMSNVTFMRFIKKDGDGFSLDEDIGLKNAKPLGFEDISTIFSSNMFEETIGRDVSLMDVFTSPQTMVNPDINNSTAELSGFHSGRVIDPFVPFLTLNSVSIDNAGMGAALFSSKVGSMSLTLHDRSRLGDISKLVAANQFGKTKIILEFGWSHPDGATDSGNIIGRFLNSLRDRSVYVVKSSNFSFADGNTVKIDLSLACFGADETRSISAAAGSQVPLSTFSHAIEDIVQEMIRRSKESVSAGSLDRTTHNEVRHILKVGQRNTTGTTALTTYDNFKELTEIYSKIKSTPVNPFNPLEENQRYEDFKSKLVNMLSANQLVAPGENPSTSDLKEKIESAERENTKNATQLLYGKLDALTRNFSGDSASYNLDPFRRAVVDYKSPEDVDKDFSAQNTGSAKTVTLGKILMSFVGHSLAMSGLFDEVQMFFYPLNEKSGGARIHTTASFPIMTDTLKREFTMRLSRNPNLSIRSVFNLIERKLVRDRSAPAYGVSVAFNSYEAEKEKLDKALEEINTLASSETSEGGEITSSTKKKKQEILDAMKLARDNREIDVRQAMTAVYSTDGGPNCEPELVIPNLSMYIETLPAQPGINSTPPASEDATELEKWLAKTGADLSKTICRVHIYDEESTLRPQEALLNRMINEGSAGQAVVTGIGESKKLETFLSAVRLPSSKDLGLFNFENTLINYVQKADANVIKEAIKKGYPSINYGASTGVVKSISVSSNVSSQVSQAILIGSHARSDNPQDATESNNGYDEVTVVPATISVEMMGMPLIQRGNEIYIDFGTQTTLDNIYVVKTVKHSISAGNFSTTVELVFAGQGKTSSVKQKIIEAIQRV